jgi:quercetin dioxygenase-like cupin family protein
MVIFQGEGAPTLDETQMMDMPVLVGAEPGGGAPPTESAKSAETAERLEKAAHLTVPFFQEGPGGFSLVRVEFGPGYLLPRHSHSSDCLYYIIGGELTMGTRVLGPGDGFFLPAEQPYTYQAGPEGVTLLEFRHQASFDIKIYEKDLTQFMERAAASMDAATR